MYGGRLQRMGGVEGLRERYAEGDFVFRVGAVVLEGILGWEDAAGIVSRAEFAAVRRPGQAGVTLDSRLRVHWFEMDMHGAVSSGQVRRALAAGEDPVGLNELVCKYILDKRLYS